ncbi:MAG: TPM domain-containing protein [Actinobacteria bacterium]|nr:TPM domain-containing protein [Actinomycetota bacterium]
MRMRWAVSLAVALILLLTGSAAAASATAPVTLGSSHVLDDAGVLTSAQVTAAEQRLATLKNETGLDLWVVYVDTFTNPSDSGDWANSVAQSNGLGTTQYLLAVAVSSRQYYLSGDSAGPLTDTQIAGIEQKQIQPALAGNDWAGAVDAAATGMTSAAKGGSTSSGGFGGWAVVMLLLVVFAAVLIFVVVRRRRKKQGAVSADQAAPQIETQELARQASSALIQTDDAIKTSDQELGFAKAQFGDAATTEFEAALTSARANLDQAFAIKQQLDDDVPDTDAQIRDGNTQIIQLCAAAGHGLDEKAAAFDELRKLEQNAPEAFAAAQQRRTEAAAGIDAAVQHLHTLQAAYAPEALATVADNIDQARQRIAFADAQLTDAQTAIGSGDGGAAAVGIRAAEDAIGQATLLEDAIEKLGIDLAAAAQSADALIRELEGDIAAASALPDPDARIAATVAAVRQQLDTARADLAGTHTRPLVMLQALEAANQQIDTLVQGVRDAAATAQRNQQMLGQLMLQAQGQVSAAEDYITARRGAVGAEARTRLAQAGAELVQAQQVQAGDPTTALAHAQRANQLAGQALSAAQTDVGAFSSGGMGGLFGQGGNNSSGSGGGMLGAVLGGIVINSLLSGGSSGGRSSGGMFGGGGRFGGGSTGSFGGGGTRARRGGGRF